MIALQRLNYGRWCGLGAVYVPPDKNSEFEAISYGWKMSGAIGTNPEFHAGKAPSSIHRRIRRVGLRPGVAHGLRQPIGSRAPIVGAHGRLIRCILRRPALDLELAPYAGMMPARMTAR
jgi:hypothetical protein